MELDYVEDKIAFLHGNAHPHVAKESWNNSTVSDSMLGLIRRIHRTRHQQTTICFYRCQTICRRSSSTIGSNLKGVFMNFATKLQFFSSIEVASPDYLINGNIDNIV